MRPNKQSHLSRAGASTFVIALVAVAGCLGPVSGGGDPGAVRMQLVTTTAGTTYRLHNAHFTVDGPAAATLDSESNPGAAVLTTVLPPGAFTLTLADGWDLERQDSGGAFFQVDATLVSPNPTSFHIAAAETTNVAYQFKTDGTIVTIGTGMLDVSIQVISGGPDGGAGTGGGGTSGGAGTNAGPAIFAAPVDYPVGGAPFGLALGVIDNSGFGALDLAVGNYSTGQVSVLLNTGNGAFGNLAQYPVGVFPGAVAIAHFVPTITTLVIGDFEGNQIFTIDSDFGGHFPTATPPRAFPVEQTPAAIVVDALNEVAVANYGSDSVMLFKGSTFALTGRFQTEANPNAMASGDLDGDGLPDLVVADFSGSVNIALNAGQGTVRLMPSLVLDGMPGYDVALGDTNGDHRPDVVVATGAGVTIFLGFGNGTFGPPNVVATGDGCSAVDLADLNGDGRADIVTADSNAGQISVLLSDGQGGFAPAVHQAVGPAPVDLVLGDVNGDQRQDVVISDSATGNVSVLLNITP